LSDVIDRCPDNIIRCRLPCFGDRSRDERCATSYTYAGDKWRNNQGTFVRSWTEKC